MSHPLTAVLSDLHGNAPALEAALEDARERGVRRFVCLGDVVGYGARPRHNLDLVMRLCVAEPDPPEGFGPLLPGLCLLGNHEHALLYDDSEDFNPTARRAIEWTRQELAGGGRERAHAYWDFLGRLEPAARDGEALYAHGSPRDPVREYLVPRDALDPDKMRANFARMDGARVCFVGHSHVPAAYTEDGGGFLPGDAADAIELGTNGAPRAIVNVGSIGQPRDGDNRLSYALWDGRTVRWVRLAYDVAEAQAAIRAVPELPDYLADRLAVGR